MFSIEKGAETIFEILAYLIFLSLPLYEINKAIKESRKKSQSLENRISSIEEDIKDINENIKDHSLFMENKINNFSDYILDLQEKIKKDQNQKYDEMNKLKNMVAVSLNDTKQILTHYKVAHSLHSEEANDFRRKNEIILH